MYLYNNSLTMNKLTTVCRTHDGTPAETCLKGAPNNRISAQSFLHSNLIWWATQELTQKVHFDTIHAHHDVFYAKNRINRMISMRLMLSMRLIYKNKTIGRKH
jgi:hypothetical protein